MDGQPPSSECSADGRERAADEVDFGYAFVVDDALDDHAFAHRASCFPINGHVMRSLARSW